MIRVQVMWARNLVRNPPPAGVHKPPPTANCGSLARFTNHITPGHSDIKHQKIPSTQDTLHMTETPPDKNLWINIKTEMFPTNYISSVWRVCILEIVLINPPFFDHTAPWDVYLLCWHYVFGRVSVIWSLSNVEGIPWRPTSERPRVTWSAKSACVQFIGWSTVYGKRQCVHTRWWRTPHKISCSPFGITTPGLLQSWTLHLVFSLKIPFSCPAPFVFICKFLLPVYCASCLLSVSTGLLLFLYIQHSVGSWILEKSSLQGCPSSSCLWTSGATIVNNSDEPTFAHSVPCSVGVKQHI